MQFAQAVDENTHRQPFRPADREKFLSSDLFQLVAQELAAIKQSGVVKKDEEPLDEKADEGSSAFVQKKNIYASSAVDQPAAKAETPSKTASGGGGGGGGGGRGGGRLASGSPPAAGLGPRKTGGAAAVAGRVINVSAVANDEGIDVQFILWASHRNPSLPGSRRS